MRLTVNKLIIVVLAITGMLYCPASAQSRKQIIAGRLRPVGYFQTPVSVFRAYSYGAGNVNSRAQYNYGGALSSVMSRNPLRMSMSVRNQSLVSSVNPSNPYSSPNYNTSNRIAPGLSTNNAGLTHNPGTKNPPDVRHASRPPGTEHARFLPSLTSNLDRTANYSALMYLEIVKPESKLSDTDLGDEPVKSLAPDASGTLRNMMIEGEKLFRDKSYRLARSRFEMAYELSMGGPESMLSLWRSYFASSQKSFDLAAYYLSKSMIVLPELPMLSLHPKNFYGDGNVYEEHLKETEAFFQDNSQDAATAFVLAYLKWRDNKAQEAGKLLAVALANTKKETLIEAIHILWDGMVASKAVTGTLTTSTNPVDSEPALEEPQQ